MRFLSEFNRIMASQSEIALATSNNDRPNVRIVNFCHQAENNGVIFFSTFKGNLKIREFVQNNQVAFTTIPAGCNEHVRVHNAVVQKSDLTIYDVRQSFVNKVPGYDMLIEQAGDELELYEIHFKQADVTIDYTQSGTVDL